MSVENRHFNLPHLYLVPRFAVIPLEFCRDFGTRKLVPGLLYSTVCVILGLAVSVELQLVTDRQTHNDSIYHASIALHGKN